MGVASSTVFANFTSTSLIAEDNDGIAGFVIPFVSQSRPSEGYIHFVGVTPERRGSGLGADLYKHTFADLATRGRRKVKAITSPVNMGSIAFHKRMGFSIASPPGDPSAHEWPDYESPGEARVVFVRELNRRC